MPLVTRYWLSLALVLVALAAVAGVFTFARPQSTPHDESEMINLADQDYISPARVRAAFAAESVALRYSARFANVTTFSNVPPAKQGRPGKVIVAVGGRRGTVSFGPKLSSYDARFENVLVTYDGSDEALIDRIDAAVAALKR